MNRAIPQALGLVGAAALGAGVMYLFDPDRGTLRRARARRKARLAAAWTADKASEAIEESKHLLDQARSSPLVSAILPEQRSALERLIAPKSRAGQLGVVLLGTAIAATGGTLAARSLGGNSLAH